MVAQLRQATTSQLNRVEVAFEPAPPPAIPPGVLLQAGPANGAFEGNAAPSLAAPAFAAEEAGAMATLVRPAPDAARQGDAVYPKVGRNQPCPCGSGKKYKHCHGALA